MVAGSAMDGFPKANTTEVWNQRRTIYLTSHSLFGRGDFLGPPNFNNYGILIHQAMQMTTLSDCTAH